MDRTILFLKCSPDRKTTARSIKMKVEQGGLRFESEKNRPWISWTRRLPMKTIFNRCGFWKVFRRFRDDLRADRNLLIFVYALFELILLSYSIAQRTPPFSPPLRPLPWCELSSKVRKYAKSNFYTWLHCILCAAASPVGSFCFHLPPVWSGECWIALRNQNKKFEN